MNYNNFARPESELGGVAVESGYPCEECGTLCDETFCSAECEADAHTCDGDCDDFDPGEEFEDDGQPSEYEEWQDLYGGDDWDHGQFDE